MLSALELAWALAHEASKSIGNIRGLAWRCAVCSEITTCIERAAVVDP